MEKSLNISALEAAMTKKGFNQSSLSQTLEVSREAVSKWFKQTSFPKPDKLLKLGMVLGLPFNELVTQEDPNAPVVAFRKRKGTKTTEADFQRFDSMGRYLEELAPYLPFDNLAKPPVLKNPRVDYDYLQEVSVMVRKEINLAPTDTVDFKHLIRYFRKLQAVLIPVMWGQKARHENATHVYLPESMTTWIYLNLDVNIHDFLFWMAHELGHALAPDLRGEEGEDFADAFAGALLFPNQRAEQCYRQLKGKHPGIQVNTIKEIAKELVISPLAIFLQVQAYAKHNGLEPLELKNIHGATTNFNKAFPDLINSLIAEAPIQPERYVKLVTEVFESPFFKTLSSYLKETKKTEGFIQTALDIGLVDAKALHHELT
ncbi:helix-turn-helix domain-containing protein [Endozoicomonas atrinae]|uniref:helix-turn-helix domain-containing protein n=1 Tax=Endozoicomonas atrinae TaxID=1333660 RepID=UPI000825D4C1|nr:helix-turn-helix transcriptional regulator [Endozoicomonas atrinae]